MNQEIKEKWVDALRSGNYKQGKSKLRNADNTFCCLGVLCDVVNPKPWQQYSDNSWSYQSNVEILPSDLYLAAGITCTGDLKKLVHVGSTTYLTLAQMNDSGNFSFQQIADIIEEQF